MAKRGSLRTNKRFVRLELGPGQALLLQDLGIPLGPLAQELADNLATGELGHGLDKGDATSEALVLGDARGHPVLDVPGLDLALRGGLDLDIGAGKLFVVAVKVSLLLPFFFMC